MGNYIMLDSLCDDSLPVKGAEHDDSLPAESIFGVSRRTLEVYWEVYKPAAILSAIISWPFILFSSRKRGQNVKNTMEHTMNYNNFLEIKFIDLLNSNLLRANLEGHLGIH